ncbi:type II holin, partial [Klebsiella pneumoniae]|nr:type II holin [Klebsiella pneumoniae]
ARLFWGLSLNEWFYVAAIAYTVVQIGAKVVDKIIDWKKANRGDS